MFDDLAHSSHSHDELRRTASLTAMHIRVNPIMLVCMLWAFTAVGLSTQLRSAMHVFIADVGSKSLYIRRYKYSCHLFIAQIMHVFQNNGLAMCMFSFLQPRARE
jgi:hypothetical protein